MKKIIILILILSFLLCGCSNTPKSSTYFYFDTAVTITAYCSSDVLDGAFELCQYYENLFSRTKEGSDISKINASTDFVEVNSETALLISKALYYCELSGGKYDITITPVSVLYDFNEKLLPTKEEAENALKKVDYKKVSIEGNKVCSGGATIDLGSIAKGYIADKLVEYFTEKGVKNAVINLGGNVYTLGKKNKTVGIKTPFSDEIALYATAQNSTFVTSGIDQRFIEKDGVYYHHIIDKETGFGVQNSLASVTVIGKSSADADALSTVCMLLGKDKALSLINSLDGYCAVFIEKDGSITLSSGLTRKGNEVLVN